MEMAIRNSDTALRDLEFAELSRAAGRQDIGEALMNAPVGVINEDSVIGGKDFAVVHQGGLDGRDGEFAGSGTLAAILSTADDIDANATARVSVQPAEVVAARPQLRVVGIEQALRDIDAGWDSFIGYDAPMDAPKAVAIDAAVDEISNTEYADVSATVDDTGPDFSNDAPITGGASDATRVEFISTVIEAAAIDEPLTLLGDLVSDTVSIFAPAQISAAIDEPAVVIENAATAPADDQVLDASDADTVANSDQSDTDMLLANDETPPIEDIANAVDGDPVSEPAAIDAESDANGLPVEDHSEDIVAANTEDEGSVAVTEVSDNLQRSISGGGGNDLFAFGASDMVGGDWQYSVDGADGKDTLNIRDLGTGWSMLLDDGARVDSDDFKHHALNDNSGMSGIIIIDGGDSIEFENIEKISW
ncbi:MAG: hypothetical protein O2944_10580 [Proteobacteria bacterium]|nr:hypothetical protein [Pseudomonadota bacterium]